MLAPHAQRTGAWWILNSHRPTQGGARAAAGPQYSQPSRSFGAELAQLTNLQSLQLERMEVSTPAACADLAHVSQRPCAAARGQRDVSLLLQGTRAAVLVRACARGPAHSLRTRGPCPLRTVSPSTGAACACRCWLASTCDASPWPSAQLRHDSRLQVLAGLPALRCVTLDQCTFKQQQPYHMCGQLTSLDIRVRR